MNEHANIEFEYCTMYIVIICIQIQDKNLKEKHRAKRYNGRVIYCIAEYSGFDLMKITINIDEALNLRKI